MFGVSPGVIDYGRRMNALCALAAAGYPTALELHHPPRGSAQSAQLQAFAVQAGFLGLVVISEQLRTEILRLLPNLDPASVLVAHDGARGDRLNEPELRHGEQVGRAEGGERRCQEVENSGGA